MSFAGALALAGSTAPAQTDSTSFANAALSPELVALLRMLPKWSTSTALATSYGYKDNLLLSFVGEERSAFVRGGVELMLLRVPRGQFDYSLYAEAERTHYFSAKTADHDAKIRVRTEPGYRFGDTLKVALPLTGYYYDQVFDVSDTDVERLIARLKVKGVMAGPLVRWDFHPGWWIEGQAIGQKKRYDDGANDGRIGEGNVRLGWKPGDRFDIRVSGAQRWRDFERRSQYSSSGRELAGTELKISEREGEIRFDVTLDKAGCWNTTTRASLLRYRDNGSGYFNYREQKVAHEVEWRSEPWLVRIGGSAGRLDFGVQKVGIGIDPRPSRLKDEFTADLHLERQISKRWSIFGSYVWERDRSNDEFASYRLNEGLLGMRWSWEK